MPSDVLEIRVERFIASVVFGRPPVNALDVETMRRFIDAFGELAERDDVRVAVLTGRGRTFCAGMDKRVFDASTAKVGDRAKLLSVHRAFFAAIREFPKPLIAAVNGPAVGAGFALAGGCDIMLACETAFFAMPEVAVGQPSGAAFITGLFGQSKGRRLFFTGDRIWATEMKALGLIEASVPQKELMGEAMKIAASIAKQDPEILRAAKQTCLIAADAPYPISKSLEYSVLEQLR
jgi:enoyl-CoA hydratase